MPAFIKICGVTRPDAVAAAAECGATHIGFAFFEASRRHLPLELAAALGDLVPVPVKKVALTVDADDETLARIVERLKPDLLQLHGQETPARVAAVAARFKVPVMKAVAIASAADVAVAHSYESVADRLLLDAKPPPGAATPGGNARVFDWRLIAGEAWAKPFVLSGGLTPENVAAAVAATGTTGVDVSSGVESEPGIKDADLIRRFVEAARAAIEALRR